MTDFYHTVYPVDLPKESLIASRYGDATFSDSYCIIIPADTTNDPEVIARFLFSHHPTWINSLMGVRDFIVQWFGLKTAKSLSSNQEVSDKRVGIFKIYDKSAHEIILGEDDKHLDFRVSVLLRANKEKRELVVTTVVHCHNLLGRSYIKVISPFHRRVIRSGMLNGAKKGWPLN